MSIIEILLSEILIRIFCESVDSQQSPRIHEHVKGDVLVPSWSMKSTVWDKNYLKGKQFHCFSWLQITSLEASSRQILSSTIEKLSRTRLIIYDLYMKSLINLTANELCQVQLSSFTRFDVGHVKWHDIQKQLHPWPQSMCSRTNAHSILFRPIILNISIDWSPVKDVLFCNEICPAHVFNWYKSLFG